MIVKPPKITPRGVAVRAEPPDEAGGRTARLPEGGRVGFRVHGQHRADGRSDQQAEPEQEHDRDLLPVLGGRDVQAEHAPEREDERDDPGAAREVAPEVGAERGEADGHGHEPHHLAEHRPAAVACGHAAERLVGRIGPDLVHARSSRCGRGAGRALAPHLHI
jgi:hypothetical protein